MVFLIGGLLLWSVTHLSKRLFPSLRDTLMQRLGEGGYKAGFSILIVLSLVLIVYGWRHTPPTFLYYLGVIPYWVGLVLMLPAVYLLTVARLPARIKLRIRHPQLSGVMLWAAAHLLMNTELRSVLLFATLLVWAMVEIVMINRAEPNWQKSAQPSMQREWLAIAISLVVLSLLVFGHSYFTGMAVHL